MMRVALLGNPNVGKSSLFNSITGETQKVANWPGKTIQCRKGSCKVGREEMSIFDLPGTYSLSPFSEDEMVVDATLKSVEFDVLIQIVDSSNLERNLYLTTELLDRTNKLVVALNMVDVAEKNRIRIDENILSERFGIPFVKIDARRQISAVDLLVKVAETAKRNFKQPVPLKLPHADIVKGRYAFISAAMSDAVRADAKETSLGWLDNLSMHPYAGPPLFLAIMFLLFHLTFFLSGPLSSLVHDLWVTPTSSFAGWLESLGFFPVWVLSLVENGIISGVGSVISFFPPIAVMTFLLYFLEDSGYLARAVVVLDGFLKRLGLGGKAFIPLLLGFGCNVPAVLATRIIRDSKTRFIATLNIPFMSCSARLPVYVLFAGAFFPGNEANVIFFLYLLGFAAAISSAFLFKKFVFRKENEELLIELPKYQWPHVNNLIVETKSSVTSFAQRAGTIILAASITIWFLASAPYGVEYGSKDSFAGLIGGAIAPFFSPLGFNSWQSGLALLNGMVAKEIVVSSLATTYGVGSVSDLPAVLAKEFTPASAFAFMVFVLLYIPCFATIGTIKSETKSWKMTLAAAGYYVLVAYSVAFIAYSVLSRLW